MSNPKIFQTLSLAKKAGAVKDGEYACEKEIRAFGAYLVIVAEDASDNTRKKFSDMASYREIPLILFGSKDRLGQCIGKGERAVLVITDAGFGNAIQKTYRMIRQGGK